VVLALEEAVEGWDAVPPPQLPRDAPLADVGEPVVPLLLVHLLCGVGVRFKVLRLGFSDVEFMNWGFGFRAWGSRFWVWLRVEGLELRVHGVGVRV